MHVKSPDKYPKMATRLLQPYKTNLQPLEAWIKTIATKVADSEFRKKDK